MRIITDEPQPPPVQSPPSIPADRTVTGFVEFDGRRTQFTLGQEKKPILCDRVSTAEEFLRSRVNSTMPDVECQLRRTYHPFEFDITVSRPDFYSISCCYPPLTDKPARELPEVYRRRNRCAANGVAKKLGELYVATGRIPQHFIFVYRSPKTYIVEVSPGDDVDGLLTGFEIKPYAVVGEGRQPDWQGRLDAELERQAKAKALERRRRGLPPLSPAHASE